VLHTPERFSPPTSTAGPNATASMNSIEQVHGVVGSYLQVVGAQDKHNQLTALEAAAGPWNCTGTGGGGGNGCSGVTLEFLVRPGRYFNLGGDTTILSSHGSGSAFEFAAVLMRCPLPPPLCAPHVTMYRTHLTMDPFVRVVAARSCAGMGWESMRVSFPPSSAEKRLRMLLAQRVARLVVAHAKRERERQRERGGGGPYATVVALAPSSSSVRSLTLISLLLYSHLHTTPKREQSCLSGCSCGRGGSGCRTDRCRCESSKLLARWCLASCRLSQTSSPAQQCKQ
jgi:hypothetical protein